VRATRGEDPLILWGLVALYQPPPPSPFSTGGVDVDVALLADAGGGAFALSAQAPRSDAAALQTSAASKRTGMLRFFMGL
jgi:hypothetical protein